MDEKTSVAQTLASRLEWEARKAEQAAWETWQDAKEVWLKAKEALADAAQTAAWQAKRTARQQATEEEAKHSKERFQLSQDSALLSWILSGGDSVYEAMNDPATTVMNAEELKAFLLLAKAEEDFTQPVPPDEAHPDVVRQNGGGCDE